jgi:hypothetical protein
MPVYEFLSNKYKGRFCGFNRDSCRTTFKEKTLIKNLSKRLRKPYQGGYFNDY